MQRSRRLRACVRRAGLGLGLAGCLGLGLATGFGCVASPPSLVPVEDGRLVMGTVLDVSLLVPVRDRARARQALEVAFESAGTLDSMASRFEPASAVSRLNAAAGGEPLPIDPRLRALLQRAEEGRRETRGAFDVTVGPLVVLWTRAAERGLRPSAGELAEARRRVGGGIRLGPGDRAALPEPGMSIDLGGIAKGFALDEIALQLRSAGLGRGLLSFGRSSLWALGRPVDAPAWRLAIGTDAGGLQGTVDLRDQALSVSSSLGQWSEIGGTRFGHVVDPRSGEALTAGRRAVVVADDATTAEVLSTALLILSPEEGRAALRARGAEALVVEADGASWHTPGWPGTDPKASSSGG